MTQFKYTAKDVSGKSVSGLVDAAEPNAARARLRAQKLTVQQLVANEAEGGLLDKWNPFKPKVKSHDLVIFSRQLATLVNAGVPIVQGLNILSEQIQNPAFRSVVSAVKSDIEGGIAIADALKNHPKAFDELYVSMVRAGEVGGILDTILDRLSGYMEATEELRGKVKGAMVYPAVVSLIATAITIFLLTGVIPTFKTVFASFGAELPLPTQLLLGLSDFLKKWLVAVIVAPIGGFIAFRKWSKTEQGRAKVDAKMLKMPVLGDLLRKVAIAKFSRTLGTLIKSGVPILQALDTVAKTSGNKVVEDAIMKARESIREGEKIAEPLRESGVFPPMVIQMISVGEETGSLDTMLTKIADFYDREVDTAVKAMTSLIEPLIIVVMGLVIGSIVIAMFFPIFELSSIAGSAG